MRDFRFNLAASDPLSLFEPEEMDTEGNLYECALASAWLASTLIHGSLHLHCNFELHQNMLNAQVAADNEEEEHSEFLVVTVGDPSPAWINMSSDEKQNSKAFTFSQRHGEDAKDRSIKDAVETCAGYFKTKAEHMTVAKWIVAFSDATTEGSSQSSEIAYNLRLVGSDLALTSPDIIFMVHEWIDKEHLRPQTHSYVWLAAVSVFGPLWAHHDSLVEAVAQDMLLSEEATAEEPAQPMQEASDASTVASADTAPAGQDTLQQMKLSGKHRKHHLRYDLRLNVPASQEADKTMIKMAKTFFSRAKEMDSSLTLFPWAVNSKQVKVKDARSIPEQMGAFKTFFHQAQPKVIGGFVYMRVWLGHDKPFEELHEDLKWWMTEHKHGLYRRSVQAENTSPVGWLLCSTRDIN